MQATISVQQQLTWGNCGNNCLSFLVGCFDVWWIPLWCTNRAVWSLCQRGRQWHGASVRYMLARICGAFHDPHCVRLAGGQMRGWREEQAEHNSCRSDPGRWKRQLLNRDFFFFSQISSCTFFPRQAKRPDNGKLWCPPKHLLPFRVREHRGELLYFENCGFEKGSNCVFYNVRI